MKKIKKIIQIGMIGGLAAVAGGALAGCGSNNDNADTLNQAANAQGAFVIIEETAPGQYKIKDQYPSDETRVVLKDLNGTERILSKEEMDALIKEEAAKIDNGTSNLTKDNGQISSGGLSLGETLLASAAGAILGSWIVQNFSIIKILLINNAVLFQIKVLIKGVLIVLIKQAQQALLQVLKNQVFLVEALKPQVLVLLLALKDK